MSSDLAQTPPATRMLMLATASWVSAAVSAVATLGVADQLASGPAAVEDVAKAVGADSPTLYRLLRACADLELFEEMDDEVFALTELGHALRSDAPVSMRNFAMWVGLPAERFTWSELAESVRTGQPSFERVHGQGVWDYMGRHPEVSEVFNKAMTEASSQLIAPIVAAYDFSSVRTVVDVAGGQGALLAAVLAANPSVRGILYDQPDVVAGAGLPFKVAGVSDRCEAVGGNFFQSVPAGADAYLLSNVIHDWDDDPARQILANCRDAMTDDGRVLLVEAVMPEAMNSSPVVKLMDLNMLVLCGGRQRTQTEFGELFGQVGLKLARIIPAGLHSIIEAVRG